MTASKPATKKEAIKQGVGIFLVVFVFGFFVVDAYLSKGSPLGHEVANYSPLIALVLAAVAAIVAYRLKLR